VPHRAFYLHYTLLRWANACAAFLSPAFLCAFQRAASAHALMHLLSRSLYTRHGAPRTNAFPTDILVVVDERAMDDVSGGGGVSFGRIAILCTRSVILFAAGHGGNIIPLLIILIRERACACGSVRTAGTGAGTFAACIARTPVYRNVPHDLVTHNRLLPRTHLWYLDVGVAHVAKIH